MKNLVNCNNSQPQLLFEVIHAVDLAILDSYDS